MKLRFKKTSGENPMKYILNAGMAFLSLSLVGCNLYEPTKVTDKRVQVKAESFVEDVEVSRVDDAYIAAIARHYTRYGEGDMDLILTYDPRSYRNTAMQATNKVSDIAVALRDYGVENINPNIMPIKAQGDVPRLLVSYEGYTAHAPDDCDLMAGLDRSVELGSQRDYKLGCSIETMVARQVSRPGDLLGKEQTDMKTEGRSASNIVDVSRTGALNAPLEGETASGAN